MYWRAEEDAEVEKHVKIHGEGDWKKVAQVLGRTANSCYLRWFNHLKPDLEHNDITNEEAIEIIRLHKQFGGNQWSKIAKKLWESRPDKLKRTANKIKNYWNKTVKKKALELNLEVDTEYFVITMTNILMGGNPPTPTPDFGPLYYDGFDLTSEGLPPANLDNYFNGSLDW